MNPAIYRFLRYAGVGVSTFLLDLGMLYAVVNWLGVPYYIATFCTFIIAVSINYAMSRLHVFKGTDRGWYHGYAYFAGVALCGALVTTGLVTALVAWFGVYYILARILVAGIVGIGNYLFNLHINFRVAGKH